MFDGETVAETLARDHRARARLDCLPPRPPRRCVECCERCLDEGSTRAAAGHRRSADRDRGAIAQPQRHRAVARAPSRGSWSVGARCGVDVRRRHGTRAGCDTRGCGHRGEALPPVAVRVTADIGVDALLVTDVGTAAVLSPNGQLLVFVAQKSAGDRHLYVRRSISCRPRWCPGPTMPGTVLLTRRFVDRVLRGRKTQEGCCVGRRHRHTTDAPAGAAEAGPRTGRLRFSPTSRRPLRVSRASRLRAGNRSS